ncbi:MAG: hypothetical protein MUF00_15735 [Gemmatimonadaceae bacterium]|nr:hypothetical protein [Gemmatimonadaceae bacterium]
MTWICLELPHIPAGAVGDDSVANRQDAVAVECNSGAERAVVLLSPDWADGMTDGALVHRIAHALGR